MEPAETSPSPLQRLRDAWPDAAPADEELLTVLVDELLERPGARLAVVEPGGRRLARALRATFPAAAVLEVPWPPATWSAAHVALTARNPYRLVVDVAGGSATDQLDRFRSFFMHLDEGGSYLLRDARTSTSPATASSIPDAPVPDVSSVRELVLRARESTAELTDPEVLRDLAALGASAGEPVDLGSALAVPNLRLVRPKLRSEELDAVLPRRRGLGRVVARRPGAQVPNTCDFGSSSDDSAADAYVDPYAPSVFDVPPQVLRRYDDVVAGRGQILVGQGLLLPDTFRHTRSRRLMNNYTWDLAPRFGMNRTPMRDAERLAGGYFQFDSEWSGHFGHTMTEQLSRMWAWERVRALDPDVRLLTTLTKRRAEQELQDWELDLLRAFDVDRDRVVVFDRAVRPERLWSASQMFGLPEYVTWEGHPRHQVGYVHPELLAVWDRVASSLLAAAAVRDRPARIFLSRRGDLKRACRNREEVEEFFGGLGFAVLHPEDHPLAEQVAFVDAAETVAGFAGSGMFTLALARRPTRMLMLAAESYSARNEYLIAAARGHRLRVGWSRAEEAHPVDGWTGRAFASSFTVDLAREGRYLADQLEAPYAARSGSSGAPAPASSI